MPSNAVRLHRVLKAAPEKVYKAFVDPDGLTKWMPPYGFTAKVHSMDVRVGGGFRMTFTNFTNGKSESFGGKYIEVKPGERLKYTDRFDNPDLPGEMTVTVDFKKVLCGTELTISQEGIPAVIPAEFCYLGWQECLAQLAHLVEPEINE